MYISANMGLKIWNLLTDLFDHTQLESNFAALDLHDHTVGNGVPIPTGGIADGSITLSKLATSVINNLTPTGTLLQYGGSAPPASYLLCDGSAVSRSTYAALFGVLGSAYGSGDGSTTFNLPDLRQRFPLGKAASGTGATLGASGGAIDHTHSIPGLTIPGLSVPGLSMPSVGVSVANHSHPLSNNGIAQIHATAFGTSFLQVYAHQTGTVTFSDNGVAQAQSTSASNTGGPSGLPAWNGADLAGNTDGASTSGSTASGTTGVGTTGGGTTGTGTTGATNPPYVVVNYIIKY